MNKFSRYFSGLMFLLVFVFPLLCQGSGRSMSGGRVPADPPVRGNSPLGKYVFIDKHLALHSSYDCKVFDTLYQVHILDTADLRKVYYFSYCSHCVNLKQYEELKELVKIYQYKKNADSDKIEEVPRAELKEFLEEHPEAVFVKKVDPKYVGWEKLEGVASDEEKFPLVQKGVKKVKEKLKK